ncbi:MAG: CesT family type III secretion system chaperone [Pseudomonadota bacterium]
MTAARARLEELVGEISALIGADLALDPDGECQLETDLGEEALLSPAQDADMIVVTVPLVELPEKDREALLIETLVVNSELALTGTARIAIAMPEGMFVLRHGVDVAEATATGLLALADRMIALGAEISQHLVSGRHVADEHGVTDRAATGVLPGSFA